MFRIHPALPTALNLVHTPPMYALYPRTSHCLYSTESHDNVDVSGTLCHSLNFVVLIYAKFIHV